MSRTRRIAQLSLAAAVLFGAGCTGEVLLADDCLEDLSGAACEPADPCAGVDCSAHGECVSDSGKASCECDLGFEALGLSCQVVDDCKGVDCGAHGSCVAILGVTACQCDSGFEASGLSCLLVDPCKGVDCGAHGSCLGTSGTAACECDLGFEASGLSCLPVDPCKGVDCGAHGRCVGTSGAAACQCDTGFEPAGLTCVAVDPCRSVQCGVGAHCAAGACACDDGLSGDPAVECQAPTSRELEVRTKLVQIATAELGMCEGTNQRPYMERQPGLWCYDFVDWVHLSAGEGLGMPLYLPHREPQSLPGWRPKAGDLIKYTYQHYAMVKAVDGDLVYTLEGNVGGCVTERATSYASVEYYGTLEASFQ